MRTIRRYKLGYIVSSAFCFVGLIALLVVMWKAWPEVFSSPNPVSAFWDFLWDERLLLIPGVEFMPMYLVVLAVATLTAGAAVFAYSRQWFFLPGENMKLKCPFCNKYWRASYDRGQVVCPHCHHLVHPRLTEG